MKKFLLLILCSCALMSCSDDVKSNSPSIQGELNGVFFRATNSSATIDSTGIVKIVGTAGSEILTLKVSNDQKGAYTLGEGFANAATFEDVEGNLYETGTTGAGQITISRILNGKISGEFYFDAHQGAEGDTINFNKGAFFDVPIIGTGGGSQDTPCETATDATAAAEVVYNDVMTADPQDSDATAQACTNYKTALQAQINACGDGNGDLQDIIDDLGDCAPVVYADGSISVTAGTDNLNFDLVSITLADDLVKVLGESSTGNGFTVYFELNENEVGNDIMQNFRLTLNSIYYPSTLGPPNDFNNTINVNEEGLLSGTFSGLAENNDGGVLELTNGTFDLTY